MACLLGPLVLLVVFCCCLGAEYGWQPQKEYLFSVQGSDLAGLPQLKPQYAGFRYNGELRVQTHSSRVLLLKLINMNYTKIHEEFPEGWWKGPENVLKNKTKTLPLTTSTIVVKMTKSKSPELVIHSGLDDWQINFIKGIVSNILAYFSDSSSSGSNFNKILETESQELYSVFEDSVVGRCEVLYEVNRLPAHLDHFNSPLCDKHQLWEITKTHNYSNCQLLNEDHSHLPTRDCTPAGSNCGNFWTRATLTQMIGCGRKNNFVLFSSVSSSSINAQLHLQNNSQAIINSNLNITLISVLDINKKFTSPQNKQTLNSLLYSYTTSINDHGNNSEEENVNYEPDSFNGPIDSRDGSKTTKNGSDKTKKSSESRQGIRNIYNQKYKVDSDMIFNKDDKNSNDYSSNKQRDYNGDLNTLKTKKNSRNFKGRQMFLEESDNQPSEELQLEKHLKISGKDQKNVPPHQPFNIFTLAHRTSYDLSCLNPKLQQIISDIASDLEEINIMPEKNTMDKLSLAVDICRSLPLDQLNSVSEEVFEVHSGVANIMKEKERKVFRDVVTMCGTHPALQLIKGWIEREQVEVEEAAEMIASLPSHIFSPTTYIIEDFFEIILHVTEKGNQQLTTDAVLALSNLIRDACVNPKSRRYHFSSIVNPVCDQRLVAHITQWITQRMYSESQLSRMYIEALGNIGSPEVITTLRDVALNSEFSSYLQTSAVFAMRYQVLRKYPQVVPLLMSLYHNYSLPVSTRIAAAALLIYSDPGLALWQRLALSTWYEPSSTVSQFVTSTIHSVATTSDVHYNHMANSAYLVQTLARPNKFIGTQPYNLLTSWRSNDLEKIILEQLSWIPFYDFTNLYYRHSSRSSGFSRVNIEASFSAANPDDLWSILKEIITSTDDGQSTQHSTQNFNRTLVKIQESLGLHSHSMPQLQAEVHFKINNMMERMLLVNKDTFKSWAKGGRNILSKSLAGEKTLSYQKADMSSFHISTTTQLGFPVEFTVRTPWIVHVKANLNISDESMILGAGFMYSSQLLSSVSVMSPWDNTANSAGAYATNFVQLPHLQVAMSLDSLKETVKIKTGYIDQHRLLYFSMQPFTSQRKIKVHQATLLNPDTIRIKLGEIIQMPLSWLSQHLNTVYSTEVREYFNPMDFIMQARSILGFPLMMVNMETRSFETVMNPLYPIVMNISMSTATKTLGFLELNSPKDNVITKIFNALNITNIPEQYPHKSFIKPDNSTTNIMSPKAEKMRKPPPNGQNNKEATSVNKTIPLSLEEGEYVDSSSSSIKEYQVYPTTYESATGNFNASKIDPFVNLVNGSGQAYLIQQIFDKINSGKAVVFQLNMLSTNPNQPTKLSCYAVYATTYSNRASRFGFFVKKDSSQIRLTSTYEAPIDIASNLKRYVSEDLRHNIFLDYIHIYSGQPISLFVKARLGLSRPKLTQLRASHVLEACSQTDVGHFGSAMDPKCQELKAQVKEISFGNITVYYNEHAKFLENAVRKYINAAKVMLQNVEEKSGEHFNTMTLMFDINQATKSVSSYITTPVSSINIFRFPLYKIPFSTIIEWALQGISPTELCGISTQRVKTFDGADFKYSMKKDWHLVTSDCSGKYGISVICQPTRNNSLMTEVNIDDHFVISLEEGPKVYVNNKLQVLDTSHALLLLTNRKGDIIAHIVFTPDSSIHIRLPRNKLDMVYASTSLVIQAEPGLQGRLCGLCGTYSNKGMEKFITAQGSSAESLTEFTGSYVLKNSVSEH